MMLDFPDCAGVDTLIFSPHPDDAAFSCAGVIIAERQAGRKVAIVTVFSRGGPGCISRTVYWRRRREDCRAWRHFGVPVLFLGFTDAPYRGCGRGSYRRLMLEHPAQALVVGDELQSACRRLVQAIAPQRLYIPLGAGTHVDHILVHEAALSAAEAQEVLLYEDRPYAFLPGAVDMRLAQLGVCGPGTDCGSSMPREVVHRFFGALRTLHWASRLLPPGNERFRTALLLRKHLRHTYTRNKVQIVPRTEVFDERVFTEVQKCAAAYTSQFCSLFGSRGGYLRETEAYCQELGFSSYCERYWQLRSTEQAGGNRTGCTGITL
jgi:LmbE family N-acetylglucosaminyl deacetylase